MGSRASVSEEFKRRQFIRFPFTAIDTGAFATISPIAFRVLILLWRYVWRSYDKGHPHVRRLAQWGWCVAFITQSKIARLVGVQRQRVNVVIGELVSLGWVYVLPTGHHRPNVYVLGADERTFFEEWLAEVDRRQERACARLGGTAEEEAEQRDAILAKFIRRTERAIELAVVWSGPVVSRKEDPKTSSTPDTRIEKTKKRERSSEEERNATRTLSFSPELASIYEDRSQIARPRPLDREEALRRYVRASREREGAWDVAALAGFLICTWERTEGSKWNLGPVKFRRVMSAIADARRSIGNRGLVQAIPAAVKQRAKNPASLLTEETFLLPFDVTGRLRKRRRDRRKRRKDLPAKKFFGR
jgi:DNA-binding MarR family transcriptional regulator